MGEICTATGVSVGEGLAGAAAAVGVAVGGGAVAVGGGAVAVGVLGISVGGGGDGRTVGGGVGRAVAGGGVGAPMTVTVPRMVEGCTAQKYPNVPACPNETERDPVVKSPVSKEPLSARAECAIPSWFVHVTLSPTLTVTDAGTNRTPCIATAAFAAAAACAITSTSAIDASTGKNRCERASGLAGASEFHERCRGGEAEGRAR